MGGRTSWSCVAVRARGVQEAEPSNHRALARIASFALQSTTIWRCTQSFLPPLCALLVKTVGPGPGV